MSQVKLGGISGEGTSGATLRGLGRPKQQSKVYVMTQKEAEDAPDVITSTIFICVMPIQVLIDLGGTIFICG